MFQNYETIHEERIAAEKRAEEERIAAEKRADEQRLAAKKRAEKEREEAERIAKKYRMERIEVLKKEKSNLESELPKLIGFFKNSKRKDAESRLAAIEAELKKLEG